jgi:geranylgeranyl pyrophosphate synthase
VKDGAFERWLEQVRAWFEPELERHWRASAGGADRFVEAVDYALFAPGKRLRPALVVLVCEGLGGRREAASGAAAAVEMVHAYSLVHDDLPCMDDDDLRRGRPTCHKVYGQAVALLVGDALQSAAFEALARGPRDHVADGVAILARAIGAAGMVGGQVLDLELAQNASRATIEAMHQRKTGALIAASAELGSLCAPAEATPEQRAAAGAFGRALGALFQAVDDILDVTGDAASLGKTPGKDASHQRATLVAALGLEGAQARVGDLAQEARRAASSLGFAPGDPGLLLVDYLVERRA